MYLSEVRVEASQFGALPDLRIGQHAHYVREGLIAYLSRKYELDGSSVAMILCGPRGIDPQWLQVLGITRYYVEDFDVVEYSKQSVPEREETLLQLIEDVLTKIAVAAGNDPEPIRKAAAALRAADFRYETEIPKLARSIPGAATRIRVYRTLSREQQEAWILRVMTRKGDVIVETSVGEGPIDHRGIYKAAVLESTEYTLLDRLGRVTFRYRWSD